MTRKKKNELLVLGVTFDIGEYHSDSQMQQIEKKVYEIEDSYYQIFEPPSDILVLNFVDAVIKAINEGYSNNISLIYGYDEFHNIDFVAVPLKELSLVSLNHRVISAAMKKMTEMGLTVSFESSPNPEVWAYLRIHFGDTEIEEGDIEEFEGCEDDDGQESED